MDKRELELVRRHLDVLIELKEHQWSRWINGASRRTLDHERAKALEYAITLVQAQLPAEEPVALKQPA